MRILRGLGAFTWDSSRRKRSSSSAHTRTECRVSQPPLAGSSLGRWRNNSVVTRAVRVGFRKMEAIFDERENSGTNIRHRLARIPARPEGEKERSNARRTENLGHVPPFEARAN